MQSEEKGGAVDVVAIPLQKESERARDRDDANTGEAKAKLATSSVWDGGVKGRMGGMMMMMMRHLSVWKQRGSERERERGRPVTLETEMM